MLRLDALRHPADLVYRRLDAARQEAAHIPRHSDLGIARRRLFHIQGPKPRAWDA